MQFSYLEQGVDPIDNLMGSLFHNIAHRMRDTPAPVVEMVPEVELTEDWKSFGETLSNYKLKYGTCLKELRDTEAELKRKRAELNALVETEKVGCSPCVVVVLRSVKVSLGMPVEFVFWKISVPF